MKNITNLIDEVATINTQIKIGKLTFTAEELASLIMLADENDTTDRKLKNTIIKVDNFHCVKIIDNELIEVKK